MLVGEHEQCPARKTSASQPPEMAVNVNVWGTVQSTLWATPRAYFKRKYGEFLAMRL